MDEDKLFLGNFRYDMSLQENIIGRHVPLFQAFETEIEEKGSKTKIIDSNFKL